MSNELLNAITNAVYESSTETGIFQRGNQVFVSTTKAMAGLTFLLNQEEDMLRLAAHNGLGPDVALAMAQIPLTESLFSVAMTQKTAIKVNVTDTTLLSIPEQQLLQQDGLQMLAITPLLFDRQALGINCLLFDAETVGVDESLLLVAGKILALAIANQQHIGLIAAGIEERLEAQEALRQDLELRARQAEVGTQVSQEIAAVSGRTGDLFNDIVALVHQRFDYDQVHLYTVEGEVLRRRGGTDPAEDEIPLTRRNTSQLARSVRSGDPLLVQDAWLDTGQYRRSKSGRQNSLRARLILPITLRDEVLGLLDVQNEVPNSLTREDELLLTGVCGQIAVVINAGRLEDRRQAVEEKYRIVLESIEDGYYEVDIQGRLTFFNDALAEIFGYGVAELMGMHYENYTDATNASALFNAFQQVTRTGDPTTGFIWEVRRPDNTIRAIETSISLIVDEHGRGVGFRGIARDVSERMAIEADLRLLSTVVEQSVNTVVVTDLKGYIEYVNPMFSRTTGYTREEALGEHTRLLKSGEMTADEYTAMWDTINAGETWHGVFHNKKKNGELYWEDAYISPIRNTKGEITKFLAVKQEITRRKLLEQEREALLAQAEERANRELAIRRITENMRSATSLEALVKITAESLGEYLDAGHTVVELGLDTKLEERF